MKIAAPHLNHFFQKLAQGYTGHVLFSYSTVSRSTSSIVVWPSAILIKPLFRKVIIPISSAFFFNSSEEAPTRINSRRSSLISITSYKPTRPLYPELLHTLHPRPTYTVVFGTSSGATPASINACAGIGDGSLQFAQIRRTRRWAHIKLTDVATRNGSIPMFMSRLIVEGASLV